MLLLLLLIPLIPMAIMARFMADALKSERDPAHPSFITTVREFGYRFVANLDA